MINQSKIQLSSMEMEMVTNADLILTKNGIIQKVRIILEHLQSGQQQILQAYTGVLPAEVMDIPPKISRGENYKGLPYLVLDYPRYFGKENHFAIRTMFWWGNFFSITLHLAGKYKKKYENALQFNLQFLKEEDFFICTGTDAWEHHFETSNYLSLQETNSSLWKKYTVNKEFIKLAKMYPLEKWDNAENGLLSSFSALLKWLTS